MESTQTAEEEEIMSLVLFMDDMKTRHFEFQRYLPKDVVCHWAFSAEEAKNLLDQNDYDQVFLDHDLCEDDIMIAVGAPSKVPTGMTVVDYIVSSTKRPKEVIVHTCNGPASDEMVKRLKDAKVVVHQLPFPYLLQQIKSDVR